MNQLREMMENAGTYIGKMGASQKLLLGSLAVIAAMTIFLVSQYASKPAMVDLIGESGNSLSLTSLRNAGIDAQVVDGQIKVPPAQQSAAVAVLAQSGQLPGDTTLMFGNLIGSQDWKASKEQHRQQYYIALQNELSKAISQFRNVRSANVILDVPQTSGLGRAVKVPSASITMFSQGGGIGQGTVDAVAGMVMGAVSGLNPKNIQVIDGTTGQSRSVSTSDSRMASQFMDQAMSFREDKKQQIQEMLGHIPGVIVSVTAMVDVKKVASTEKAFAKVDEGTVAAVKTQQSAEDTMQQASRGAEPGVRSNQTASINTGSGAGNSSNSNETVKEYENQFGYTIKETIDHRGMPTHITASIIIPDEYIREILTNAQVVADGAEPEPISAEDVQEWFSGPDGTTGFKQTVSQLVSPHLMGLAPDGTMLTGEVMVSSAPIGDAYRAQGQIQSAGFMGSVLGSGGGGSMMLGNGNLVETVLVGILAAVSVLMMLMMVKKSSKNIELPTAEELVGLPPQLDGMDDLIGEADESDAAMTGIEVEDATVQIQQLREQVSELIKSDPESAAGLVDRWAEVHD